MKPNGKKNGRVQVQCPERIHPASNFNPDKEVLKKHSNQDSNEGHSNGHPNGDGSALKSLREKEKASQRSFARRLGLPRVHLQRLETRSWESFSVADLKALSKGLGISVEALFSRFEGFKKEPFVRACLKKPFFSLDLEGARFGSLLPEPGPFFFGTLTLPPHKTLSYGETPRGEFLFYLLLEGELLVKLPEDHLLRPGEGFPLKGTRSYELYNPHQFKEAFALLLTYPSFIRKPS